jgi:hypothetical protein
MHKDSTIDIFDSVGTCTNFPLCQAPDVWQLLYLLPNIYLLSFRIYTCKSFLRKMLFRKNYGMLIGTHFFYLIHREVFVEYAS